MKSLSQFLIESKSEYSVGQVIRFQDGEDWKITKVLRDGEKFLMKPHNTLAKQNNISLEIEFTLDFIKSNVVESKQNDVKESADYNKQPLKVGDAVEVIDYDDAVGKIVKLDGNSATVEIKSGAYAGKSKHETKNLVKL